MGSWRKVGAFLGLVPDEGRRDEFGDDYQDAGRLRGTTTPDRRATLPRQLRTDGDDSIAGTTSPYVAPPALGARRLRGDR